MDNKALILVLIIPVVVAKGANPKSKCYCAGNKSGLTIERPIHLRGAYQKR